MPTDPTDPTALELRQLRGRLPRHRSVQGRRAARRRLHRQPSRRRTDSPKSSASRGESAYVVDVGPFYLASIVECLGSKAMVADAMQALTGRSHYAAIAQDTIAMAVNDLITVGATPLVVQAYWAAGGSEWFADAGRAPGPDRRLEAGLRDLQGVLGRRRDAGPGRHRRGRPDRPRGRLHRHRQPEGAAVARRSPRARRRDRPARLERHPRQRPQPRARARRSGCRRAT